MHDTLLIYKTVICNIHKIAGFLERLKSGDAVLVAEGYMWEFDRRGYLQRGSNAPEVVLEHPDLVKAMHHEFVHAGSDVVLAFTVSLSWTLLMNLRTSLLFRFCRKRITV